MPTDPKSPAEIAEAARLEQAAKDAALAYNAYRHDESSVDAVREERDRLRKEMEARDGS